MTGDMDSTLNFVKRAYPPRVFGMALAFPVLAVVLYQQQSPWPLWVLAFGYGFLWPHGAYFHASRAPRPLDAEHKNLVLDAFFAGLWVPLLSFNLLPSLVLLSMTGLGNITAGGWALLFKGLVAAVCGMLLAWFGVTALWSGFSVQVEPTMLTLIAVAPLVLVFPLALGSMHYALSRQLIQHVEELAQLGRTDMLSQLSTRRFWEESVFTEFERHRRSGSPLSLIMIDIDNFKALNAQYGQIAGDQLIRDLAELLSESVREADLVGRCGGEEFGLLLPDTDIHGAMQFAERIRISVQTLLVKPYEISCTISLGVATADAGVTKYRQLIERADKALYLAKRSGRNISIPFEQE